MNKTRYQATQNLLKTNQWRPCKTQGNFFRNKGFLMKEKLEMNPIDKKSFKKNKSQTNIDFYPKTKDKKENQKRLLNKSRSVGVWMEAGKHLRQFQKYPFNEKVNTELQVKKLPVMKKVLNKKYGDYFSIQPFDRLRLPDKICAYDIDLKDY